MSMPCQYHVNTNTRSIPRQCQVNNTAIPRQYHVKSTSIPCPYHVRTTSIPRHYRVYTTSIPIPGSPQLVCASLGPCALVCPCLPRSWSCVLGRVWFVCALASQCLLNAFSMPSQCPLDALSMPSQCPLDALLMPPQCLLHAFSMAEHLAAGSEGWGPRRRAPTSRLSSSLHRMHSLSQRTVAPRSLGWP